MKMNNLRKLIPGSVWKHNKKQLDYIIIGLAKDTTKLETQVIYRQMYPSNKEYINDYQIWSRPLKEFLDNNGIKPRFEHIGYSFEFPDTSFGKSENKAEQE